MTLDEIGLKHGTDKSSAHHDYLNFYEQFFARYRDEKVKVLEIGVLDGASLATWEEYFPRAEIVGADIILDKKRFQRDRVGIEILDQSNIAQLVDVGVRRGPFDIVIEDGSHLWEHQVTSLRTLFPFVKDGGIYIAEDLQTNYGAMQDGYRGNASHTCVDFLKRWLDLRVADDQIDVAAVEDAFLRTYGRGVEFLTFYRRACLIRKAPRPRAAPRGAGDPNLVSVVAHVAYRGDVLVGDDPDTDQGAAVQALCVLTDEDAVEYRARLSDRSWTAWARRNQVVGTKGEAKALSGLAVRLLPGREADYTLDVAARFSDGSVRTGSEGGDLVGERDGQLHGVRVVLTRKGAGAPA